MNNISNRKELEQLRHEMALRQESLESKIRLNWLELKSMIKPAALARETLGEIGKHRDEQSAGGQLLSSTLEHGAAALTRHLIDRASGKLRDYIHKKKH
jgi:hypothetical protein